MNGLRIYGLPGTGKTWTLIEIMKDKIRAGTKPSEICYNTFLRKMSFDLKERMRNEMMVDPNDFKWITTTHGICNRLLGNIGVVTEKDKEAFCKSQGLEYVPSKSDDAFTGGSARTVGQALFDIRTYLVNNMMGKEEWASAPVVCDSWRITRDLFYEFCESWEQYKQGKGVIDFDDMLLMVYQKGYFPNVKILMVDEYQDVTPIQHAIVKMWSSKIPETVICGDKNQCIYSFSGADPAFYDDWSFPEQVLRKSYRMKRKIWDFVKMNYPVNLPDIETQDGGHARKMSVFDVRPVVEEIKSIPDDMSILVLCRCNFQVGEISRMLMDHGVPVSGNGSVWTPSEKGVYNAIYEAKNGGDISIENLMYVLDKVKTKWFIGSKADVLELDDLEMIKKSLKVDLSEMLSNIFSGDYLLANRFSLNQKRKVMNALIRWNLPLKDIEVSNIHQKKGGEADCVFLINSITPRIAESIESGSMDESRVLFTAMTRAKERLYVVEGLLDSENIYNIKEE